MTEPVDTNGAIELTIEDEVAEIRLSNPDKRNAVSAKHIDDLFAIIDELEDRIDDGAVSAILLTHEGPVFCAGYDMDIISDPDRQDDRDELAGHGACRDWLWNVDVPVVIGASGPAVAAGAALCNTGDIVVAGEEFQIWWPEINVGVFNYSMGPDFINRVGGIRPAAEIFLLGDEARIGPHQARELNLVNRIVDTDEVDQEARHLAETLARYEREYGVLLEAYEVFNTAKRAYREQNRIGMDEGEWRSTYDEWFRDDDFSLGGPRDDPRADSD